MNWNKAVNKIEKALTSGKVVSVEYHRKWMKNDRHFDQVDGVTEYEWEGSICKGVSLYHNFIDEGTWIIDKVDIEER